MLQRVVLTRSNNKNLSIRILPSLIGDSTLAAEVQTLVDDVIAKSATAREHRNKRLAHQDLAHSLALAHTKQGISREQVGAVLEAFATLMNRLELHYCDTTVAFDWFISMNDADTLLSALRAVKD